MLLDEQESWLLRRLVADLRDLLQQRDTSDPVDRRLFPDAHESREDAMKYKALVESELVSGKLAELDLMEGALEGSQTVQAELETPEIEAWLRILADMRLALGVRLGVDEERMTSEIDPDDPDAPMISVLGWLGWLQEGILSVLMEEEER